LIDVAISEKRIDMPKTKVRAEGLVKIPDALATKYCLRDGDILDVRDLDGSILFIPEKVRRNRKLLKALNDRLWDLMEQEAEEDINAGRVAGPFETLGKLLRDLKG